MDCSRSADEIQTADSLSLEFYIIADLLAAVLITERGCRRLTAIVDLSAAPGNSTSFCFLYFEVLYSD